MYSSINLALQGLVLNLVCEYNHGLVYQNFQPDKK